MIRLHEFITKIRNCKTIAEERAQYQKEMAAIRESFSKNQVDVRPRNLTKLLFINMSGQDTNFGQMECLNLITAKSPIQKRIGYLGLTQLFHEKSELLMMSTHRIKVDLISTNTNVIGLALCVVSEICTIELAKQLQGQILKCVENKSNYIKKKAILTLIKLIKKLPQIIPECLPKVIDSLETKNHGVLLSCMSFLQAVITLDPIYVNQIVVFGNKFHKIYKFISMEANSDYAISGAQDPFLQVAILRLLKTIKKITDSKEFNNYYLDTVIAANDTMSGSFGVVKNGSKSILYQCFQCAVILDPTSNLKKIVDDMLTKFISTKDANSKYLSLINLGLMSKYDINITKNYKGVIIQCLAENDILIQKMALDLLYIIASPDNVDSIAKELLNILLSAIDEQFISQLALKICLIVEKHSQSRRWQFDTILKVLILADQAVKEDTSKSLVHLIMSTPQLQKYCMAKLFFSTCQNTQNDALCKITLYLLGQLANILPKISQIQISEKNIIDLIEQIIFRATVQFDTISYGLSALMKIFDKFTSCSQKIIKILKHFENHCDLQVQKRACEYIKLLDHNWDNDRKTEISIPIPAFKGTAQTFSAIPVGDLTFSLDLNTLKMPEKVNIIYNQTKSVQKVIQIKQPNNLIKKTIIPIAKVQQKQKPLIDDDDDLIGVNQQKNKLPIQVKQKQIKNDPFNILELDIKENNTQKTTSTAHKQNFNNMEGIDFLSGFVNKSGQQKISQNQNKGNLLNDNLLGENVQNSNSFQTIFNRKQQNQLNLNQKNQNQQSQQSSKKKQLKMHKFKGFQNEHLEIWYELKKQSHNQTAIKASFMNKTQSFIDNIVIQIAIVKYLKITINPFNSTALSANSKGGVYQTMTVINSSVNEKPIVMKIKLQYVINGQRINTQSKIEGFPLGF